MSVNGSPLARPDTTHDSDVEAEAIREEDDEEFDEDSDDELPDPKAYEAKLAKSQRALGKSTVASTSRGKPKRGPSLMFRQSLAPSRHHAAQNDEDNDEAAGFGEGGEDGPGLTSISLQDGRIISFNPLHLSPTRIEDEMKESGMGEEERDVARSRIKDTVVRTLAEHMEKWKGLG